MTRFHLLLALISVGSAGCRCGERPTDAGIDADSPDADQGDDDREVDRDRDEDRDADADVDDGGARDADHVDADPDEPWRTETGTLEELCADAGPIWTWSPFECSDASEPDDCCPSCRRLTCREMASQAADIWEDFVVYQAGTSVGVVNLETGEDWLFLPARDEGELHFVYAKPTISSRYIVAQRKAYIEGAFAGESIIARGLSASTDSDIVLDTSEERFFAIGLEAYEEWVTWGRQSSSTGLAETVLQNIETGEQRILDQDRWDYSTFHADIWGDRVVWGATGGLLREHRISTGVTRNVLERPELEPMFGTSVWEHYAVYNWETSHAPWNIYLVDLDTAEVRLISPPDSNQTQGSINGGRVIWTDFRGAEPLSPGGMHVYVYSLRTGREYVVNPSAMGGSEPLIFGQNVVWGGVWNGIDSYWVTRIGDI